jgi:hypothetical protein
MTNYFKSSFKHLIEQHGGLGYPNTWYGVDYIPGYPTVDLYNDDEGWLIAHTESKLPTSPYLTPLTEAEALKIINDPPESKDPATVQNYKDFKGVWARTAVTAKSVKAIADKWTPKDFDPFNIMGEGHGR